MKKRRLVETVVPVILLSIVFPRFAYAYMDPGTTGSIFALFAPFFAIFLAFLGFLIRPVRRFFMSIFAKLRMGAKTESLVSDERPVSDFTSDDESSGKETIEDSES
jgi:hypothetical protein